MKTPKTTPRPGQYVRGLGTLIETHDFPPPPQPEPTWIFEEVHAIGEIRLGKDPEKPIVLNGNALGTIWEFKGKGSAVDEAIDQARGKMKNMGITPDGEAEIVVIEVRKEVMKITAERRNFYDPDFFGFDQDPRPAVRALAEKRNVVWTSRHPARITRSHE